MLRECLSGLVNQKASRQVEIVVIDNRPDGGRAAAVVAEFPDVTFMSERRVGVSYARNAGIAVSHGEIIVIVDDDTVAPPEWLENLIAPFCDPNIDAVAGNVYPVRVETECEQIYENHGGHGRGNKMWRADHAWFKSEKLRSCKAGDVGVTANMAFRASLFADPQIGTFDEHFGPGSPTGAADDTLLIYKILRARKTISYNPCAVLRHRHRAEMGPLRRQLFNYSKSFVAYQLETLFRYGDYRAIPELLAWLPVWHVVRVLARLTGRSKHPLSLSLTEMAGNLLGPLSLWQSYRRVARLGKSPVYVPPYMRPEQSMQQVAKH
jgi:glycosyltransferase involved in cell wall biosynthesis